MIFELLDGRQHLFQWDLNRKLAVKNETIKEVHFCNRTSDCSLVVEVVDGIANIPNVLLQKNFDIKVYGYDGEATLYEGSFAVKARTRPTDYVYTETDILTVEQLAEELRTEIDERLNGVEEEVKEELVKEGFATTEYVDNAIANIDIPESSGSINEYATQDFKIDSTGTYYKINVDGTTEALAPEIVELVSSTGLLYDNIYNFFKSQILRCEHTGGRGRITLEDSWNTWGTNGTNGNKLWAMFLQSGLEVCNFTNPLPKALTIEYIPGVFKAEVLFKDNRRAELQINEVDGAYTSTGWQEVRYADTEVIELVIQGGNAVASLDSTSRNKVAANPEKYIFKVTHDYSNISNAYYRFSSKEHFDGAADLNLPAADYIYYSAILKDDFGAYKVSNLKVLIKYNDSGTAKSASATLNDTSFNNYYTKDETYSKTEIDEAISNIPGGSGGASYNAGQDINITDNTISTVYGGGYEVLEGEVSGYNTRTWHNGAWSDAPVSNAYRWFLYIGDNPQDANAKYELGEDFWTLICNADFDTRITFYINTGHTDLTNNYITIDGEFYATKVEDPEHTDCWILQFDENEYWDKWYLDTYEKGTTERPRLQCYGKGNYEWCLNTVPLTLNWTMIGNYVGYVPIDDNFISANIARTEQLNSLEERIAAIESIANAEGGAY